MARLNDFLKKIDMSELNDYVEAHGTSFIYTKGDSIVQQGQRCLYIGVVKSG